MPASLSLLIGFQLLGEIARRCLHLPLPGPVIGLFLLAAVLLWRRNEGAAAVVGAAAAAGGPTTVYPPANDAGDASGMAHLGRTANGLVTHMGLLFIPSGVGIITQGGLLRQQWLPVAVGVIGSTLLSLAVTALVFHHMASDRS